MKRAAYSKAGPQHKVSKSFVATALALTVLGAVIPAQHSFLASRWLRSASKPRKLGLLGLRAAPTPPTGRCHAEVFAGCLERAGWHYSRRKGVVSHNGEAKFTGIGLPICSSFVRDCCLDRKLAEEVLKYHGLPVVEAELLINYGLAKSMKTRRANWPVIQELFRRWGRPLVFRGIRNTGGEDAHLAQSDEEAFDLMQKQNLSYVISPFIKSNLLWRAVVGTDAATHQPKLLRLIRRTPLHVQGDGQSHAAAGLLDAVALRASEDSVNPSQDPAAPEVVELALRAASAVGLRFGAVDILPTPEGGLKILDLNTNVLTDVLDVAKGDELDAIVREQLEVYEALEQEYFAEGAEVAAFTSLPRRAVGSQDVSDGSWEVKSLRIRDALQDVASSRGFTVRTLSMGLLNIVEAPDGSCSCRKGHEHGLNLEGVVSTTRDKVVTYEKLHRAGLPAVPHIAFDGLASASTLKDLPVVIKSATSGSGSNCFLCESDVDCEVALQALHGRQLCVSPYQEILCEYRVWQMGGRVIGVIRKDRPTIRGDGASTAGQLLLERASQAQATGLAREKLISKWKEEGRLGSLSRIPAAGEEVLLAWKHNLQFGAEPTVVAEEDVPEVVELARQTAAVTHFNGAVDVVLVKEASGEVLKVLELNSCPGLDKLLGARPDLARRIMDAQVCFKMPRRLPALG